MRGVVICRRKETQHEGIYGTHVTHASKEIQLQKDDTKRVSKETNNKWTVACYKNTISDRREVHDRSKIPETR